MVDVIKIFIKMESLVDHNGHLSCIVTRILDTFSAAGHHQYVKSAQLYCQLMKLLETLPGYKEIFEKFTAHRNYVVRYSCHGLAPGMTSVSSRDEGSQVRRWVEQR